MDHKKSTSKQNLAFRSDSISRVFLDMAPILRAFWRVWTLKRDADGETAAKAIALDAQFPQHEVRKGESAKRDARSGASRCPFSSNQ